MKRRAFVTAAAVAAAPAQVQPRRDFKDIPEDFLREPDTIPPFWVGSVQEVTGFLDARVRKGKVAAIGKTAGGRPIRAVFYGTPRARRGSTTFSGSLGFRDVKAYLGPDSAKKVYWGMSSVHGGEFEGIVGTVNLLAVIETGKDLRGREWPEITAAAEKIDRLILIPIANVDGRARVPLRMIRHQGTSDRVHEYFNTGAKADGSNLGWPQCKEFIPLDFTKVQFPGGYPNDAGVNIQHDDFFGVRQPETDALLALAARERPDLTMNMHTGAQFIHPLRSFIEPALMPWFETLYRRMMKRFAMAGLQPTRDGERESDPARERMSTFNLDTAINLHCGALAVLVESPAHNHSNAKRDGKLVNFTPEELLDAQLICHQEAMKFLVETGGRVKWTPRA
ncbi:MAG: hypothetical protein HY820_43970 [Acidobacteria bacterium]|nr:hypothetical protein [Acidobacteriota bacterium]